MRRAIESRSLNSLPIHFSRSIAVHANVEIQKHLWRDLEGSKSSIVWLIDRTHIDSTVRRDVVVDVDTLVLSLPPHALQIKDKISLMRRFSTALRDCYGVAPSDWETTAGLALQGDDVFVAARIAVFGDHGEQLQNIGGTAVAKDLVEVLASGSSNDETRPASISAHREADKLLRSLPKAQHASLDIVLGSERIVVDSKLVPPPTPTQKRDIWSGTAMIDGFHRRNRIAWIQPTHENNLWEVSYDEAKLHEIIRQVAGTDTVVSVEMTIFTVSGRVTHRVVDRVGPHLLSHAT